MDELGTASCVLTAAVLWFPSANLTEPAQQVGKLTHRHPPTRRLRPSAQVGAQFSGSLGHW